MDQQRIKQLIDLLAESDLSELTLSEGGTTVTLSRHAGADAMATASAAGTGTPANANTNANANAPQHSQFAAPHHTTASSQLSAPGAPAASATSVDTCALAPGEPLVKPPAPSTVPPAAASQVCSPLYGVLHLTPSPDEPAFVAIGDSVTAGQTLCIVEAMKMFHQVKASQAGRLEAILATAGDEVESGQPLFSIV